MKNSGRLFFCVVLMFAFVSFSAFAEEKTYDLMTETKSFFGPDYSKKVFLTNHIVVKKIFAYKHGSFYFEIDNKIDGIVRKDYLYPFENSFNFAEYDSDIYKKFDQNKNLVKGRFYIGTTDLDSKTPYLIFVDDIEFIQSIIKEGKFNDKDQIDRDCVIIDNSGKYKKTLSLAAEAGQQDFKTYMAQDIVSTAVFARNWYDVYGSNMFNRVEFVPTKGMNEDLNMKKGFKNDKYFDIAVNFYFKDGKDPGYLIFKNSKGNYVVVYQDFFMNWKP